MTARESRGQKLIKNIRKEMDELGCKPTSTEEEALRIASSLADRLDDLERLIKRDGLLVTNAKGDLRPNPACVEARSTATSLTRVLNTIYVGDSVTAPRKNPVKQRAARRRWDREAAANG